MVNVRIIPQRVITLPPNVVSCPAGNSTIVLPSYTQSFDLPVARMIQNGDANNTLFFSIDTQCIAATGTYHGYILPNQQLDCSGYTGTVNCDCLVGPVNAITTIQMAVDYTGGVV